MHASAPITARRTIVVTAALAMALSGTVLSPARALAVSQETQDQLASAAQQVQESATAYDSVVSQIDSLQQKIDQNDASIADIESKLPALQEKASDAMREVYKTRKSSNTFLSFIMKSQNLDDLITNMVYLNQIEDSNTKAIEELNNAEKELQQKKTELEAAKTQLVSKKDEAAQALANAQKLRSEAQAKAEAEAKAEYEAQLAAQAAKEAAATAPATGTGTDNGNQHNTANQAGQQVSVAVGGGAVNWNMDKAAFVNEWAGRINNYLAGSPLAGTGATFAEAAWNNGVDPRWSPAISAIESTKGRYNAGANNAWGWSKAGGGWRSFGSWQEGITAHVAYLKSVYGTTLTEAAAKKYCPPTWQDWYNKVAAQMNAI